MHFSDEIEYWENCHGEHLTVGTYVKATDESGYFDELKTLKYMVTAIAFNDQSEVVISINNGVNGHTKTHKSGFSFYDLRPA